MIVAVFSVFNEEQFLERCLKAVRNQVDRLYVFDGAYQGFPCDVPFSTDRTIPISRQYADEVFLTDKLYAGEIEKKNFILSKIALGDYCFLIDGDEEFQGKLPVLELDDYEIELRRTDGIPPYPVYRIYRKRPGLEFRGTHHALFIADDCLNHKVKPTLPGCHFIHYSQERDQARVKKKGVYYQHLKHIEQSFREEWKL